MKIRVLPVLSSALVAGMLLLPRPARAQNPNWQRSGGPTQPRLALFHSTQAVNLPTAETLSKGEWLFEIAHRFAPRISDAQDALFGLDGPVFLRLGLSYAFSDRGMVRVERSNLQDNYDFNLKLRVLEHASDALPVMVAVSGGLGWNTQVGDRDKTDSRNLQYYGELILNTMLGERVGIGLVPWVLRNPDVEAETASTTAGVGIHGQVYLGEQFSVLGEWNVSESVAGMSHDAGTLGIELETGGHFFKIVVTNSLRLNPSQFLVGAEDPFEPDQWRLGFNITRLLTF